MGPRLCAWLLLAVALGGCSSDNGGQAPEAAAAVSLAAPTWTIGDTWLYSNSGPQGQMTSMAIVVTGEGGGDYVVDTNEPTVAYFHAVEEISYLGKIRKSDLAGSQGSQRVQYFDFPLERGKTWTTNWDGESVEITVLEITADGARMRAMAGDRLFAEYSYGSGFIGDITFHDENGTQAYRMELSGSGSGFSGTVYRYTIGDALVYEARDAETGGATLELGEATEMGVRLQADCGGAPAGSMGVILSTREPDEPRVPQALVALEEPAYVYDLDCTQDTDGMDEAVVDVEAGLAYDIDYGVAAHGGSITVALEPRILRSIPVG